MKSLTNQLTTRQLQNFEVYVLGNEENPVPWFMPGVGGQNYFLEKSAHRTRMAMASPGGTETF